jgi:glutamate--glyoxylate aminotransferase
MCALCHVARKSSSLARALRGCQRAASAPAGALAAPAAEGAGLSAARASRAYAAVPQAEPGRVDEGGRRYALHPTTLNQNLLRAEYAVRGELYKKAMELQAAGKKLIFTNGTSGGLPRRGGAAAWV